MSDQIAVGETELEQVRRIATQRADAMERLQSRLTAAEKERDEAQAMIKQLCKVLELCQLAFINEKHLQAGRGESVCVDVGFALTAIRAALDSPS